MPSAGTQAAFDRELLARWLNFANGAFGYDEEIRTQSLFGLPWSPPPSNT